MGYPLVTLHPVSERERRYSCHGRENESNEGLNQMSIHIARG